MRTGLPFRRLLGLMAILPSVLAWAEESPRFVRPSVEELAAQPPRPTERESDTREAICLMIESAAREARLPLEFFARVIWQESRFRSDAVGPVTRSGQRAQGIAQFMPGTAGERGLLDPFNPVLALPKSAEFLAELREQQTRLARDVHDVVGHSLAVILAQAEAGSFVPDEDPARLKAALAAIADSARSSLGEVRHVLASTNDGVAVQVREGLEGLVESVRGSGTPVDFMDTGLPVPLGPQAETVAYRVLQEMLTNALRHGVPGQPIDVRRHGEPTGVTVQVANAVAEGEPPNTAGSGIEGMRTRLLGVGGRLSVDRSPRRFLAVAWLPAQESDLTQPIRPVGRP